MGLFGPSLNDLAEKELALKQKNKGNAKTEATATLPAKRKLTLQEKYMIIFSSIFLIIVMIVLLSIIYTNATKPKADYEGFKKAIASYLDTNSDISEIEIKDNDLFKITVKDTWYNSSEIEKVGFCKSVHASIYAYAREYNLIYKDLDNVYLNFYDTIGIKLTKQDSLDFEILY